MILPQPPSIDAIKIEVNRKRNLLRDEFAKEIVKSLIKSEPDLKPKELSEKAYCIAEEMMISRDNYL